MSDKATEMGHRAGELQRRGPGPFCTLAIARLRPPAARRPPPTPRSPLCPPRAGETMEQAKHSMQETGTQAKHRLDEAGRPGASATR